MRSSHASPPLALGSSAGRYRLPACWQTSPPVPLAKPAPQPPTLYGLADEADAALKMRRLEAVLLLSREPLHSRKLAQFAGLADGTEARTFVRRLNQWYDEVARAFRVEQVAGGYQLMTRPKYADWIRRQNHVPPEVRLSAPALETLAVVAYRQPVLRADVDAVRGVNCGEILRLLMERDLVRITGRSEELGRPFLYGTTRRFLEVCGLMSLEDLPRAAVLRSTGEPGAPHPPLPNLSPGGYTTDTQSAGDQSKEYDVSVLTMAEMTSEEATKKRLWGAALPQPRMDDEDDSFEDDDLDDDDDDDDLDDDEDDLDDDEEDDEEEDDDIDEDFDDEWEEVDDEDLDEDEEDDEDDDEDDDWDDDEDDDDEEDEDDDLE